MVKDNPYIDTNNTRTFSKDVDAMSLIWHTDQEDRTVTVLEGNGWQFQRDNELPLILTEEVCIFIPKGQIHRIIKGQTDLKLKIEK